ncbi:MAG: amidohydrolase family protein, partial [Acidimicrobiia bacterium]
MGLDTVLVNCAIVDANADVPPSDSGIWVREGRIEAIGPVDDVLKEVPANTAEVIDLAGAHVMPRLINKHVHLGI